MLWKVTVWSITCFSIQARIRIEFLIKKCCVQVTQHLLVVCLRELILQLFIVLVSQLAGHMKNMFFEHAHGTKQVNKCGTCLGLEMCDQGAVIKLPNVHQPGLIEQWIHNRLINND